MSYRHNFLVYSSEMIVLKDLHFIQILSVSSKILLCTLYFKIYLRAMLKAAMC